MQVSVNLNPLSANSLGVYIHGERPQEPGIAFEWETTSRRECTIHYERISNSRYNENIYATAMGTGNADWGDAEDYDAHITGITLTLRVKAGTEAGNNTELPTVYAYALYEDPDELLTINISNNLITSWDIGDYASSGTLELTTTVTDSDLISKLMQYGVGVYPYSPTYQRTTLISGVKVEGATITVTYYSQSSAPTVTNAHFAQNVYSTGVAESLSWTYSHPTGAAQAHVEIQARRQGSQSEADWRTFTSNTASHTTSIALYQYMTQYAVDSAFEVRIRAKTAAAYAEWSAYAYTSVRIIVPEPYSLAPANGQTILYDEPIRLSWKMRCIADGQAVPNPATTRYCDIQYSSNGGESWNALITNTQAAVSGSSYYYDVAAGSFPSGIILWRVRFRYTYAGDYNVYASEAFTVRINASTSSVTCDGKPRPTLSWTAAQQIAYQVRFAEYNSGTVYGSAQSHTVPFVYADGNYPVSVRTQAADGSWSEWTETEYVEIENDPGTALTLTATPTQHAVALSWSADAEAETYIVYRDDVPVHIGTERAWTDVFASGQAVYMVRAMYDDNYYSASAEVTVKANPKNDCLYDAANQRWYPLTLSASPRERSYSVSQDVTYRYYSGRTKPAAFTSGNRTRQLAAEYAFRSRAEAEVVADLAGKAVIFKDTNGGKIYGILNGVNLTDQRRIWVVSFTVTEIDRAEEVEYDA